MKLRKIEAYGIADEAVLKGEVGWPIFKIKDSRSSDLSTPALFEFYGDLSDDCELIIKKQNGKWYWEIRRTVDA